MNQTLAGCLKKGVRFLESAGVPEARISAEELLSHVLGKPRLSLYLDSDMEIDRRFAGKFKALLEKRLGRYPLQYLVRNVSFRNVTLEVGEGCFIPRPETEILVETVIRRLGRTDDSLQILDIGTGSGNIAISIARECPHWIITATDISDDALHYARRNANRNRVTERAHFVQADLCDGLKIEGFDAVVSNPPYLTHEELVHIQPEVDFEPRLALDGGWDGLGFFKRISQATKRVLKKGGTIFFEVGMGQASLVRGILESGGFQSIEVSRDDTGVERIISAQLNMF